MLIKGGIHLEEAGHLKAIAFDKTGTLTKGIPAVTDVITYGGNEDELMIVTAAIEKGSQHPLASAIIRKAEENGLNMNGVSVEEFQSITGKGVKAKVNNQMYYVGSPNLLKNCIKRLKATSKKILLVCKQKENGYGVRNRERNTFIDCRSR